MTPAVDCHTHIFCWGENPADGFISEAQRRAWTTRLLIWATRIERERGATISEKLRSLVLRRIETSMLTHVVVLAQDAVYGPDGLLRDSATHFYVSNDYVLGLARDCPKVIPGASINPWRRDAVAELERCFAAGARLIKVHTAIQGVDPSLARFESFYRRAAELKAVLMFHTGFEHSCHVVSQRYTNPALLERALDTGVTVIAAHSGTCAIFDPRTYYPAFVRTMRRYPNLYGDTAVLATAPRFFALRRLSLAPDWLRRRILHGSDYPFPPSRWAFLARIGLFPPERTHPLDLDLKIKRSFGFGGGYESRILELLRPSGRLCLLEGVDTPSSRQSLPEGLIR